MAESLADMVLGFFEEEWEAGSSGSDDGWISGGDGDGDVSDAGGNGGGGGGASMSRAFWESQDQLLHEALMRSGSTESRIRTQMEEAVRKMRADGSDACNCSGGGSAIVECRRGCVLRGIVDRLRAHGYDSAVCKSKWRRSPEIPPGEHSYIDILLVSRNRQKDPSRIVIEPSFRAEFEVARGSSEYNALVARLPEIFVGKAERLKAVVKVMCRAAKRCMKENRMHMAPWRKHEYMLSKWLGTCERLSTLIPTAPASVIDGRDARQQRPRSSMLTFDLHRTAVQVL